MVEVGRRVKDGGRGDEGEAFSAGVSVFHGRGFGGGGGAAEGDAGEGGEDVCGLHFGVSMDPVDTGAAVNYYIDRVLEVFPGGG